jgi:hypothetical protein
MMGEAIVIAANKQAYSAFFLSAAQLVVFLVAARWLQVDRMPNRALHSGKQADRRAFCCGWLAGISWQCRLAAELGDAGGNWRSHL